MKSSNSSVPITAILGTRTIVFGYLDSKSDFLRILFANAKPLALPPSDPVDIRTKLRSLLDVLGAN